MAEEKEPRTENLAQAAAVDADAFERLVVHIRPRLLAWISLRMGPALRSRVTEDDVFQETLLRAHRTLATFTDQGPDSFRKWIFSVAEHRLQDLHRYHSAQKRDAGRELATRPRNDEEQSMLSRIAADASTPSSRAHRSDMEKRLLDGIDRLPEPLREIVIQRSIEERSFKEIALSVKKRKADIPGLYARGLEQLRREISGESDGAAESG